MNKDLKPLDFEQQNLDKIKALCEQIASFDIINLGVQEDTPDNLNIAERVKLIAASLKNCKLEGVPSDILANLKDALALNVEEGYLFNTKVTHYSGSDLYPNAKDAYRKLWTAAIMPICYSQMLRGDYSISEVIDQFSSQQKQALDECSAVFTKVNSSLQHVEGAVEQAKAGVEEVKKLYGKGVIEKHAGNFREGATVQARWSYFWAVLAAALSVGLAIYSNAEHTRVHKFLVSPEGQHVSNVVAIEMALSKVIVVSLLTYALVTCVRNFSSARHNVLVNRHRMNALSSYETFAAATDDRETRTQVLLEATKAVFSPQPTGLLKQEPEPSHGAQIIEIIKTAGGHQ